MTRHYPDLSSISDWFKPISHAARPIRSTTQISVVKRHQYGISETRFSDIISRGNQRVQRWRREMVAVFSGFYKTFTVNSCFFISKTFILEIALGTMAMIFDLLIGSFRELSDLPRPCRTFVNRYEIIKDIKTYLRPDPENKYSCVFVHGAAGMGKSATAIKAANGIRKKSDNNAA